ncbi:gag-pol polyprotein [Striga asiatica]|uniref:Gag-pol polyprotein n=1 Tax=Striga asiatica TaxID=4170 RepID=A0A5A7Q8Q4_STRAF|nr:gag-pol polyprotein [Striga asiatica]
MGGSGRIAAIPPTGSTTSLVAAVTDRGGTTGGRSAKNLTCYSCRKTGHIAAKCFEVISYPEWWGSIDGGRRGGTGRGGSPRCWQMQGRPSTCSHDIWECSHDIWECSARFN